MDPEKLKDKVKKDIRALLISAPLGVPAHIFAKDYRQMNGKEVPYREMGYRSLDDFILSIPDVVRVGTGPTGLVTFYPIATKETQHIVNMIRKQKKPSVKKAIIPSAITARTTPVKMSSFSRRGRFGSRQTPQGGGSNHRHQSLPLPPSSPSTLISSPSPFSLPSHLPSSRLGPDCLSKSDHRPAHLTLAHRHSAHHVHPPPNSHLPLRHNSHPSLHRNFNSSLHQNYHSSLNSYSPPLRRHNSHLSHINLPQYHPSHLITTPHHQLTPYSHLSHQHLVTHPRTYRPPLLQSSHRPMPFFQRSRSPPPQIPLTYRTPLPLRSHSPPPLPPSPPSHIPHSLSLPSFLFPWCRSPPPTLPWLPPLSLHHFPHKAKYHPRAYSQPSSYVPNLPPRLMQQRAHHQSPSYPSSVSWSTGPPHTPPFSASSMQSRGLGRNRPGSKPEGSTTRPRLASLPEGSLNKLHPQHTLATAAPPSVVATDNLSSLWRDDFKRAHHMTIEEMNNVTKNTTKPQFFNPVCVEGVTGRQKKDVYQEKEVLKILLRAVPYRRGKPDFPVEAVLLHFVPPDWDLKKYPQPYQLPEGVRLKVYGKAFGAYSKQKTKSEPSMRVMYYEKVVGSSGSSSHSSPQESRSSTPRVEAKPPSDLSTLEENIFKVEAKPPSDLSTLEENIFKLLLKFEKGTYAKRLHRVYKGEFNVAAPENILELAKAMPFVLIESITESDELMFLKDEYRKKSEQSEPQPTSSKPPAVDQTPPPPPIPSTMTFIEDRLYEVLVCCVNSPFSFYVQIRDDEEQLLLFTEMEENMNEHFKKQPSKKAMSVKENQLCACLWEDEDEGQWCRALVISLQESEANVLFPDYGNQECVSISDLRTLPPEFYQLPFQAIQCCLHGVLMKDNMMNPEVADYFAELAADKLCALQVMDWYTHHQ